MVTQIKGNSQNKTIALLLSAAQLTGHQESWIQRHTPRSASSSDDDVYMSIMEWIAQCFVLERQGDVVAVASKLSLGAAAAPASASAPKSGTASAPLLSLKLPQHYQLPL